jgi:GTP-binding protein
MFIDSAEITVKAGDGGAGAVTFRRQKYEPKGGPNGGDGGRGGDVVFTADTGLNTLLDFAGRPLWEAQPGEAGGKKQQHGADGRHLDIRVPVGTLIYDADTGALLHDMGKPGEPAGQFVCARGGYGGFGNEHYKSSTNQTPTYAHPGQSGETRRLRLELKLLADVGLIGLPNAGKSTLLAALTKATPKIANYPFTTLTPQLGVAELDATRRLVIADIPGLIEGASAGKGLGHDFLRHIERTRVLVHLLDVFPDNAGQAGKGGTPARNYRTIRTELRRASRALAQRREIICLSKLDLLPDEPARAAAIARLRADLKLAPTTPVIGLSSAAHIGTQELLKLLWTVVQETPAPEVEKTGSPQRRKGTEKSKAEKKIEGKKKVAKKAVKKIGKKKTTKRKAVNSKALKGKIVSKKKVRRRP